MDHSKLEQLTLQGGFFKNMKELIVACTGGETVLAVCPGQVELHNIGEWIQFGLMVLAGSLAITMHEMGAGDTAVITTVVALVGGYYIADSVRLIIDTDYAEYKDVRSRYCDNTVPAF